MIVLSESLYQGPRGFSAFQLWQQIAGNELKTEEDYFDWLRVESEAADAIAAKEGAEAALADTIEAKDLTIAAKNTTLTKAGEASSDAAAALAHKNAAAGSAAQAGEYNTLAQGAKTVTLQAKEETIEAKNIVLAAVPTAAQNAANQAVEAAGTLLGGLVTDAQTAKTGAETAQGITEGFRDETAAFRNAAAAIVSGGPRGVYATLAALISANPDHAYTYVVTADGHWYYWNGSTFADGGVYQTVQDYALKIDVEKINESTANEYILSTGTAESENGYYNRTTGAFTPSSDFKSKKHTIDPKKDYYITSIIAGSVVAIAVYYDINGDFISSEGQGTEADAYFYKYKLSIPYNAKYIGQTSHSPNYGEVEYWGSPYVSILGTAEAENGYYNGNTGAFTPSEGFKSLKYKINPNNEYYGTSVIAGTVVALAVFFDAVGNFISSYKMGVESPTTYIREKITIPENALFVGMTYYSSTIFAKLESKESSFINLVGNLAGKKVAWYGTSIPAGHWHTENQEKYSYANRAVKKLGGYIQNYCIPSGVIRKYKANGDPLPNESLSFTSLTGTINYQTHMIDLIGTNEEPDIFVFDYGVNDYDYGANEINLGNWDMTSEDLKELHGSFNFVISKLLIAKPTARIALFTHFSNESSTGVSWGRLNELIESVGEYWGIPVCSVHKKSNWVCKPSHNINTILTYCPDGIHPGSDENPNTPGVNILTEIAYNFLKDI